MFNKNFYPTSRETFDLMGVDCAGKIVLEPSVGKGDLVGYLKEGGASRVLGCENDPDLIHIASTKCEMVGDDFLELGSEKVSHIDMIVMNPPFDKGATHVLHAWEIAPEGCEIIALVNSNTLANDYSSYRKSLNYLVEHHGDSQDIGSAFAHSERLTNVSVSVVKLFKPIVSEGYDYSGFFTDEEEECSGVQGIMQHNEIRSIVNRYVAAVKCYDDLDKVVETMKMCTDGILSGYFAFNVSYREKMRTKEEFARHMQKECWRAVFDKMNLRKYVTTGVMKDINKFVETQQKYPFTMRNVYRMIHIIIGTQDHTFKRALEEAVDGFTKHHKENRWNVEGWATNDAHMIGEKFIVQGIVEYSNSGQRMGLTHGVYGDRTEDKINDLMKVMCNITGKNYDDYPPLEKLFRAVEIKPNTWQEWGFWEFKCFKKGTMHLKFKNEEDWYRLNAAYGSIKGFTLPEKLKKKKKKRK